MSLSLICLFPLVLADSLPNSPGICRFFFFSQALAAQGGSFSPWILPVASVGLRLALKKKAEKEMCVVGAKGIIDSK